MVKKIASIILVISLFFSTYIQVMGNQYDRLRLTVNGKNIDVEPKIIDNTLYVPVEAVSAMGASYELDESGSILNISTIRYDDLIPEVIKQVSPCVVGIIGNYKNTLGLEPAKYSEQIIHGTGIIIKSNGEILTNAHVVNEMDRIVVVLSDGSGYEGNVKSIDEESDLAVIKIDKTGLETAEFGKDEDIIIGRTVIAIGTPISFSLRNSASTGIISGVNRSLGSSYKLIQTDTAINPGNSGGPLVNLQGKVIGVNSVKYSGTGIEGLGFSIPVSTIEYVVDQFDRYGKVLRPSLGVAFEEDWAARVGLPSNNGLTIKSMREDSPAKLQGIKEGDILVSINDNNINTIVDFNEEMKKYLPEDKVLLKIKREGIIQSISVQLGQK